MYMCKWVRAQTHSGILLAIDFTGFYVSAHTGYSTLAVQVRTLTDGLINGHEGTSTATNVHTYGVQS